MSLRIAIDASAVPQQSAGAGVYTCQLVRALAALGAPHQLVVFARPGLFDDLSGQHLELVSVNMPTRSGRLIWEQTQLPRLLHRLHIDVLHSPHHHTPVAGRLLYGARTRLVVTLHDLIFMLLPERYSLARWLYMQTVTRVSARAADAFITPSKTVRDDVIRKLGIRADRVVAIPEAASPDYVPASPARVEQLRAHYGLPHRYMLSVGTLEPGKNRTQLLRAMALLRDSGVDCHLVIAGQPAWNHRSDYDLTDQLQLRNRVKFLGYVPALDMPTLYSGALLLVFPSLHEGFGLPILEAMACGVPVVTSNRSATAETAGDAALLVDPGDAAALAEAMELLLGDAALRADLRARGHAQAAKFSWQRTARETLQQYERVAVS